MHRLLLLSAVLLQGCVTSTLAKMTPDEQAHLVTALAEAGCGGSIDFGLQGGTASGVSYGSASGSIAFHGTCDPSKAGVVPLKDIQKLIDSGQVTLVPKQP